MELDADIATDAVRRLRRVHGQIAGILNMIEEGRSCRDVVQQIAAAGKALDRVGVSLLVGQLERCFDGAEDDAGAYDPREVERLLMSLT